MAHLGERAAALVDGQLSAEGVERAHAHLAGCRPCREAVEAERLMKARLAALRGPEPGADLMQRLLAMGGPNGPLPPRTGHVPGTPRPQPVAPPRAVQTPVRVVAAAAVPTPAGASSADLPAADRPAGRPTDRPAGRRTERIGTHPGTTGPRVAGPGRSLSRRRTRLAVAAMFGALSVVGVGISGMAASGAGAGAVSPTVVPPVDTFVVDHARTTADLPFVDVSSGWQLSNAGQGGGAGK